MITIEVHQNEEISGGRKNGRKGFDSATRGRRANRGEYTLREQGEVVKRDVDPNTIRIGTKRRKRGGRKFRDR